MSRRRDGRRGGWHRPLRDRGVVPRSCRRRVVFSDGEGDGLGVYVELEADGNHLTLLARHGQAGEGVEDFESTDRGDRVAGEAVDRVAGVIREQ